MKDTLLSFQDLTIGYRLPGRASLTVAGRLSAALHTGELVCLVGPNGAGKSTLLRTLTGLQPALGGEILLAGEFLSSFRSRELARSVAVVLTDPVQPGLLSAESLVALGRYARTGWLGRLEEEDRQVVARCLEAVGAEELAGRPVAELSDGERQKVMIARALAQEPALLVLDEPTAFLDLPRRVEIMTLLRNLARAGGGRAVLLSTHDLDLALRGADRLWLLDGGGRLAAGAPEDLVLSGAVAGAFRGRGVSFDLRQGAFVFAPPGGAMVIVEGDEPAALWTRRALERAGFCPAEPEAASGASALPEPARVRVSRRGEGYVWRSLCRDQEAAHDSILSLLARLRSDLPG
jgi:iron complex transport system ATP-binding protein